ncbi:MULTISPECIES: twin-arginine translocase TatA/TatE family subunit [Paenibacillus]|uniref:Sec-independent protein translocase protein TatA n=1 Tax=Paenibacillus campinasensis TaxID=66347 RepID=A0A268EX60_9BACL|nr:MULTISPECIES: twin-arginine translocase TatA/TatE family subunit [Paenibacillus]MUG66596.1 twin-arginine translocase TatA/TatE family subunit [Paenibacillus campinasensis]PAD77709.1 twin-arginine translocase TatA/TatE family subunit [Paenibacillus campinasensis]PAK52859.1 twin-arginine translocase TatA/TatE family subunit [Paenibacillus sp. 7541]
MGSTIGVPGLILLVILALLLFGPNKLPELGRAVGRTFREFKNGAREIIEDEPAPKKEDQARQTAAVEETKADNKRLPE